MCNLQRGVKLLGSDLSSLLLRVKDDDNNYLLHVTDYVDIKAHLTFMLITTLVGEHIDALTSSPYFFILMMISLNKNHRLYCGHGAYVSTCANNHDHMHPH